MTDKLKIVIKNTAFNKEDKLIMWECVFPDNTVRKLVFSSNDIKNMINTTLDIPDELIEKFCKDIKGKEKYIVINGEINDSNIETLTPEEQDRIISKYYNILPEVQE
jgi:hypothetical protein